MLRASPAGATCFGGRLFQSKQPGRLEARELFLALARISAGRKGDYASAWGTPDLRRNLHWLSLWFRRRAKNLWCSAGLGNVRESARQRVRNQLYRRTTRCYGCIRRRICKLHVRGRFVRDGRRNGCSRHPGEHECISDHGGGRQASVRWCNSVRCRSGLESAIPTTGSSELGVGTFSG